MLEVIGWSAVAAALAWGLTLSWASAAYHRGREAMEAELQYWRAQAVRARDNVVQLKQERAAWLSGCQRGREDVIAIMPLLVAAQRGLAGARAPQPEKAEDS